MIPDVLINIFEQLSYDTPISAHGGINDTLYYVPRMCQIIQDYVKSCVHRQARKMTKRHISGLSTPTGPFEV